MRLPSFRRIFKQDYEEEYQSLVDRLSVSLNYGIEVLYDALNNNLTFQDNFNASTNVVTVNLNADGTPKNRTTYTLNRNNLQATGTLVLRANNLTNSGVYPTGGIFITFQQVSANEIQIDHVTGLPADNNIELSIVTIG